MHFDKSNNRTHSREIIHCKQCLTPSSRPRITFNEDGVCNACTHITTKSTIDWDAREAELRNIIDASRSSTTAQWDCVVPWSGGKDSSAIAYHLKFKFGLNPLLVTFSPILPTEIGQYNRESLINLGFDHIMLRPNQKVHRHLARKFFIERGNPKIAWDAGINAAPVQVALNYKIPLLFYAEHGETEYGGKVLHKNSGKIRDFTEVIEHQIGDDPQNWVDGLVAEKDLNPYIYPSSSTLAASNITPYYFAYFQKWSMFENYELIKEKIDFKTHPKGRTSGTFTDFDSLDDKIDLLYYYMQYIKFGFGRTIRDASRLIQNGHITRAQGIEYVQKYDAEFPEEHFEDVLDYLSLSFSEFTEIVDKHRNSEIWDNVNGEWHLRFPPPTS